MFAALHGVVVVGVEEMQSGKIKRLKLWSYAGLFFTIAPVANNETRLNSRLIYDVPVNTYC